MTRNRPRKRRRQRFGEPSSLQVTRAVQRPPPALTWTRMATGLAAESGSRNRIKLEPVIVLYNIVVVMSSSITVVVLWDQ